MGLSNVLQSIKDAEESADAKIASSKEEAAKIIADARKEASEIIQSAQDGAVSSTVSTLDSARNKAGKEAEGVQAEGAKAVEGIQSSAGDRRAAAGNVTVQRLGRVARAHTASGNYDTMRLPSDSRRQRSQCCLIRPTPATPTPLWPKPKRRGAISAHTWALRLQPGSMPSGQHSRGPRSRISLGSP